MRSAPRLFVTAMIVSCLVTTASTAALAAAEDAAEPEVWVHAFCAGAGNWIDELSKQSDDIAVDLATPPDPAKVSDALVAFFDGAASSTRRLATRLRHAGVPDVPHGKQIANALTKALTKARRTYAQAKKDAAQLETSGGAELQVALAAAQTRLREGLAKVGASAAYVLNRSGSRKLGEALRDEDACQRFLPPAP